MSNFSHITKKTRCVVLTSDYYKDLMNRVNIKDPVYISDDPGIISAKGLLVSEIYSNGIPIVYQFDTLEGL